MTVCMYSVAFPMFCSLEKTFFVHCLFPFSCKSEYQEVIYCGGGGKL